MFKEILKASRNNQASIFAFTFKFKIVTEYTCQPILADRSTLLFAIISIK